jgi:hypothetical protein
VRVTVIVRCHIANVTLAALSGLDDELTIEGQPLDDQVRG